ncbi:MAG: T9SS type A sorting domain-containing protein [Bacteroidetes bacterium]|nr:T9SS type A sorting domain-containing protein [Bacteroidota bacterium]MBK9482080.1 T9SS type A sorting domain-containing protein [Bacteroidota bacterium]
MKKVLLIILVFASVKSFSQNAYTPMNFDTSCYWINDLLIYFGGATCSGTLVTYIEKDTLINTQQYFKMTTYATDLGIGGNCAMGFNGSLYIREDTSNRILFKYVNGNTDDTLLNYHLNTGDILKIGIGNFQIDSVSIDTVNNIPRRIQWYHTIFGYQQATLEGIGNTMNFPYAYYGEWDTPYFQLRCYSKNGITLYGSGNCIKTAPVSSSAIDKNNLSVQVADQRITITNINTPCTLNVYDLLGNQVYRKQIVDDHYTVDLSTLLQNGFYLISVVNTKSHYTLKMVVK